MNLLLSDFTCKNEIGHTPAVHASLHVHIYWFRHLLTLHIDPSQIHNNKTENENPVPISKT